MQSERADTQAEDAEIISDRWAKSKKERCLRKNFSIFPVTSAETHADIKL